MGNPPFLGGKLLRALLGDGYVDRLFHTYDGRARARPTWSATGSSAAANRSRARRRSGLGSSPRTRSAAARTQGSGTDRRETLPDHQLIVFARDDDSPLACSILAPTSRGHRYVSRRPSALHPRALHDARESALGADPKLTLTSLYNKRPTWLAQGNEALDAAVLAAYGWPADLTDEEVLKRLLALNLARAGA